jgi:hypothetical protein
MLKILDSGVRIKGSRLYIFLLAFAIKISEFFYIDYSNLKKMTL